MRKLKKKTANKIIPQYRNKSKTSKMEIKKKHRNIGQKKVKTCPNISITLISIKRLNVPVKDSNPQFG